MFKSSVAVTLLSLVFYSASGIESSTVFDKLANEVENKQVFEIITPNEHCPVSIVPEIISSRAFPYAEPNDKRIYLNPQKGGFTFESNSFTYRPNLKEGVNHSLFRKPLFIGLLGGGFSWASQLVKDGVLTVNYSSRILSVIMVTASNFKIEYNSNKDTIRYFASGKGITNWGPRIDDVDCTFKKAVSSH